MFSDINCLIDVVTFFLVALGQLMLLLYKSILLISYINFKYFAYQNLPKRNGPFSDAAYSFAYSVDPYQTICIVLNSLSDYMKTADKYIGVRF